jgi:hypothetical protein
LAPFGIASARGWRKRSLRQGLSERSVFIETAALRCCGGEARGLAQWGLALCAAVVRHRR